MNLVVDRQMESQLSFLKRAALSRHILTSDDRRTVAQISQGADGSDPTGQIVHIGDDRGVESDVLHYELRLSAMIITRSRCTSSGLRRAVAVDHGPRALELCCELLSCAMRD